MTTGQRVTVRVVTALMGMMPGGTGACITRPIHRRLGGEGSRPLSHVFPADTDQ
jgi:hypothetical protein